MYAGGFLKSQMEAECMLAEAECMLESFFGATLW